MSTRKTIVRRRRCHQQQQPRVRFSTIRSHSWRLRPLVFRVVYFRTHLYFPGFRHSQTIISLSLAYRPKRRRRCRSVTLPLRWRHNTLRSHLTRYPFVCRRTKRPTRSDTCLRNKAQHIRMIVKVFHQNHQYHRMLKS